MLPDIRAVIAAVVAAMGLLMIAFGAVATFRVAQGHHGALQADLAKRGQSALPAARAAAGIVETPGPHMAPPPPLPVVEVKDAPVGAAVPDTPLVAETPAPVRPAEAAAPPAAEPAIGGPLAEPEPPKNETDRAAARAAQAKKLAAAKKAHAARLARQRKAARRAAAARAKQQAQPAQSFNSFGGSSFGGSFSNGANKQ
jgi:hypothetical protein